MATKLWQKNYTLDTMMDSFTVRKDYILDEDLVLSDLIGSASQAKGMGINLAQFFAELMELLQMLRLCAPVCLCINDFLCDPHSL